MEKARYMKIWGEKVKVNKSVLSAFSSERVEGLRAYSQAGMRL